MLSPILRGLAIASVAVVVAFALISMAAAESEDFIDAANTDWAAKIPRRSCEDTAFCQRQRAWARLVDMRIDRYDTNPAAWDDAIGSFAMVPSSLSVDRAHARLTADVTDGATLLALDIQWLAVGGIRIRLKEKDPVRPRYQVGEDANVALDGVPMPFTARLAVSNNVAADGSVIISLDDDSDGKTSLNLRPSPLRIELIRNSEPIAVFNGRGYLSYETGSLRRDMNISSLIQDADVAEAIARDLKATPGPEEFKEQVDSKPHGPSSVGFDLDFPGFSHVYGLPEHAAPYSLPSTKGRFAEFDRPYRLYNSDTPVYNPHSSHSLYGSIPFLLGHRRSSSVGALFMNSAEIWVDVERQEIPTTGGLVLQDNADDVDANSLRSTKRNTHSHWFAESGTLDVFLIYGASPKEVTNKLVKLTGHAAMPQYFSTAYHQCRWSYDDQEDVYAVDAGFDEFDIPYDVMWLDIDHTDGKRYFTWDYIKFPDPVKMQNDLADKGRKMVTIVDPHIFVDENYWVSREGRARGLMVNGPDGKVFDGTCWPGWSNWIDYLNPEARKYWAEQFAYDVYKGSTPTLYTWNDMNEPAIFSVPEFPRDSLHHGGYEHREVHNCYGALQERSTYEGHLLRSNNTDRPFVLTRAFFIGIQRYGAVWTGDSGTTWEHLRVQIPMILSMGISGVSFAGGDVGGFFGETEAELMVRWYQVGSMQPFFRGHAAQGTKRREPWLFGEPYTSYIRETIRRRYMLLPYVYTLFREANQTGIPVNRPLMLEFDDDESTFNVDHGFLLGPSLLVYPALTPLATEVKAYLPPASNWFDYETRRAVKSGHITFPAPLSATPIFLRGGHMIPRREKVRKSSAESMKDPLTLVVALDSDGSSTGNIYLDDGHSFENEYGKYIHTFYSFRDSALTSRPIGSGAKDFGWDIVVERVIVVGLTKEAKFAVVDGRKLKLGVGAQVGDGLWEALVEGLACPVNAEWKIIFE